MRPTRGDHTMIGVTFTLDRDAAKNSTLGRARWHWTTIKVMGRKLSRVVRSSHVPSGTDFEETYEYRLDLLVSSPDGGLEYADMLEEHFQEELEEGTYRPSWTNT
jgi:hypothetical protein